MTKPPPGPIPGPIQCHGGAVANETALAHLGRDPGGHYGAVNTPPYRASTIVFPSVAAMEAARADRLNSITYGRLGNPTSHDFEKLVAALEGGHGAIAMPSGLAAVAGALMATTRQGDHVLMTDAAYAPARSVATDILPRHGVETSFYDPRIGAGIAALIRPNTKVVYVESPSSLTFEIQDIDAIAAAAHQAGAIVIADNTWATPLFFRAFDHGVDIAIHAATKYLVGHSDAMLGVVVTSEALYAPVRTLIQQLGYAAGPDDLYLGLRGLRTLDVRLKRHHENGLTVARWLAGRPEVEQVLHPGLPDHPDHDLWRRQFGGASGLFGVALKPAPKAAVAALVDGLRFFALGASWGGYESLILPGTPPRAVTPWQGSGPLVRLHIGLEHPDDLIADLAAGLNQFRAAA